MNSCHLPTCKLNKRTVKLEVTIDNKSAPSSSPCVNRLRRAHPLPLVADIPPWNRWRNNFLIDCRKREMLYLTSNFLDKTKQIFSIRTHTFSSEMSKFWNFCQRLLYMLNCEYIYVCIHAYIHVLPKARQVC